MDQATTWFYGRQSEGSKRREEELHWRGGVCRRQGVLHALPGKGA